MAALIVATHAHHLVLAVVRQGVPHPVVARVEVDARRVARPDVVARVGMDAHQIVVAPV